MESSREQMPAAVPDAAICSCWSEVMMLTTLYGTPHSDAATRTRLSRAPCA